MSIETIKSNYSHSRINYMERFMLLWLSFNAWYNDNDKSIKNKNNEIARVLSAVDNDVVFDNYRAMMTMLSDLDDPKLSFLVREVDKLSEREHTDNNGNKQISHIDTTSTKYKIIADQSNAHTTFLKSLCVLPNTTKDEKYIHEQLQRIRAFSFNEADKNTYFSQIYSAYLKMMATEELMPEVFNAVEQIPRILYSFGLAQFGGILYNTNDSVLGFPKVKDFENIFIREPIPDNFYDESTRKILKLELELLYKFRCLIFHGDINMNVAENPKINEIAKFAYEALDNILYPLMSTSSVSVTE